MKRSVLLVIVLTLLIFPCASVSAKSIKDYRNQISELKAKKEKEQAKGEKVQKKINETKAKIDETTRKIVQARKDQEVTRKEIQQLDEDIKSKEQEMKDLVSFYQISDNDNFYLKFIFGADSFEDLIYRFSVAEQLTKANDDLVEELSDLVKKNEEKVKSLKAQESNLKVLNEDLSKQIDSLGSEKKKYTENALDVDEEIAELEKEIAFFKKRGCNETQNVLTCGTHSIPSSKGFILPLSHGYITSYYGGRIHPVYGVASYHSGIDIAAGTGTTVMASAGGIVVTASSSYGGFGKAVIIAHNVGGKTYSTLYGHMSRISVSQGDIVSRGEKVGEVGSTGVSTGPHLHFQAMYGSGYGTTFNPENLLRIPLSW